MVKTSASKLLCALFLFPSVSALAQLSGPPQARVDPNVVHLAVTDADNLRFVRLPRSSGISQQQVTSIVQDGRGFLWFATQHGLNRYDGYRFRIFNHDAEDPSSICDGFVPALLTDHWGNLWTGCNYSVDRYDPVTETFIPYRLEPAGITGPNGLVRHISEDRNGMLWLSTGGGLYCLDPRNGRIRRFVHDSDPYSLSSSNVKSSGEDRNGAFWVASERGFDQFDRDTGRTVLHVPIDEPTGYLQFYEDRSGIFWILQASGSGLSILDRRAQRLVHYVFGAKEISGFPTTGVSSIVEDHDGSLWLGTFADGILKLDPNRERVIRYRNDEANSDSPSENHVNTLLEDREGNIWTGFNAKEPGYFLAAPPPFTKLPLSFHNQFSLGETLVNAIVEDRHGMLWMGVTGALYRLDRRKDRLTTYSIPEDGIGSDVIALLLDPTDDVLWVGTRGRGLYRFDTRNYRMLGFRHRDGDPSSLINDTILRLFFDSRGELWLGTMNGLSRYNASNGTFSGFRHGAPEGSHEYQALTETRDGALWVGTDGDGILSFDRDTARFAPIRPASPKERMVRSLFVDHGGAIWAVTQNGLYRYDLESTEIRHYTESDGLASRAASCILEDGQGRLWIGTSAGLSQLDPSRSTFKNYSPADGLPGSDFTGWSACFKGSSGDLFFGGFVGAVSFRPESLVESNFVPPVALTGFQLHGVPVRLGLHSPLSRSIDYTDAITLSNSQDSFSFEFAALGFRSPATSRYRYRLVGLEDRWQEVGSDRRFASYSKLPPGQYEFRVQGATSRGPWGEPGASVAVRILPPWWESLWFRVFAGLLFASAIVAVYRLRVRQIRERFDLRLTERVNERNRIARELHDSLLQGFQGLIYLVAVVRGQLPEHPSEAAANLETVLERGQRALAEGRSAVHDLRHSAATGELPEALAALGKEMSADSTAPASFRLVIGGNVRSIALPARDEIYQIAREALRNATQHAEAKQIEMELQYGGAAFRLRIRDDGIGVDTDVLKFGRRAGHFGLQGMRERARSLGGRIAIWSRRNTGTEVELSIPARIAYRRLSARRSWFAKFVIGRHL